MTVKDHALSRVSFAVRTVDGCSGRLHLIGPTLVFITENGEQALQNPSGYHVFRDLTETEVTIRIENKHYFPKEVEIDIPALDPRNPVVVQTMTPNYLYPFPAASTLVRGIVLDPGQSPVGGAQVSVAGATIGNQSDAHGRFVLYWGPLDEDDISVVNQNRFVKVSNSTTINLNVSHPSFQPTAVAIGTVVEAQLKLLAAPIVLTP